MPVRENKTQKTREQIIADCKRSGIHKEEDINVELSIFGYEPISSFISAENSFTKNTPNKIIGSFDNVDTEKRKVGGGRKSKKDIDKIFLVDNGSWLLTNRVTNEKVLSSNLKALSFYIGKSYESVRHIFDGQKSFIVGDFLFERIPIIKSHSNLTK